MLNELRDALVVVLCFASILFVLAWLTLLPAIGFLWAIGVVG
jgi:hypothetical protein